ncbi:hypothetical protein ACJMK2_029650 [Sinanodonta woodiana]|uniref:Enoyl reductase (ER) domain-containing protein n=1 Tax=Sinanodonta woodiana TaxID=1069815 RepID=A0ABD3XAT9_SINWO
MKTVRRIISKEQNLSVSSSFSIENVDIPVPGKNEVLVEVRACGLSLVNQKVITEVFQNQPRETFSVGQDVSGVVSKVGDDVSNFSVGEEVVGILPLDSKYSGCAEFCVFNQYDMVKKPPMLSHEAAAAGIGDCMKAYTALHYQAKVCGGDTVLVIDGATPFGNVAVQLARIWGAKVIATVSSQEEKSYLETLQPPLGQIIELNQRNNILISSLMEETGGVGVDVIVDNGVRMFINEEDVKLMSERYPRPVPHKNDIISCLGIGGKWITSQMDLQLDPPDSQQLFLRGASISFLFEQAWTLSYAQQGRYQHILLDAIEKMDRGIIKCKIARTVSLEESVEAVKQLQDQSVGKVVMVR